MAIYRLPTGSFQTNTYIVAGEGRAAVVDPGDDFDMISAQLCALSLVPECVLVTHGHFDHIGAVARLRAAGAKVYISATDLGLLKEHDFYLGLGLGESRVEPFDADVTVSDGDTFSAAGQSFKVMATPGHTPGGVCYIMNGDVIFSGDTLFRTSVGRTDLPYGDFDALERSVAALFALPGDYTVYPGHGPDTTLGFERKFNPYV